MTRRRSPEFIAIPMVAVAVVYSRLLYWALTAETAVAWTIFIIANVAIIVLGLVLRRSPPKAVGVEARGHVASHDPLQAAADGLREFPAEAILIVAATSDPAVPPGDVAELLRNRTKLPVIQVS